MSAPSKKRTGVGFRSAYVFALNSSNYPAASSTSVYEGIKAEGAKTLVINDPAYRVITHTGDDRALQIDQLPATEGASAELHLGRLNDDLEAAISGLTAFTVGEMNMLLAGVTDKSGFEPSLGMLAYRQALDESGNRVWHFVMFPRCTIAKHESGFADTPEDRSYSVVPNFASAHLWGTALATGTEGATQAQIVRGVAQYKPALVAWKGDGATAIFLFPTDRQAQATSKITVWVNGVLKTTNITKATTGITFTASYEPASGAIIVALYEVA